MVVEIQFFFKCHFFNVSEYISTSKVEILQIFTMNVREANMSFHNDGILNRRSMSIAIPNIKTQVLNIYPVIPCKPIPILFTS